MEIIVNWKGPYAYDQVVKNCGQDEDQDYGLYQIYHDDHPLYSNRKRPGEKILLYIGKTVKGSKFSGRIVRQGFCKENGKIFLGKIDECATCRAKGDKDDPSCKNCLKKWEEKVSDAEKVLIYKYAPAYNAQGVGNLKRENLYDRDCVIINNRDKIECKEEIDLDPRVDVNDLDLWPPVSH
jgi:hypothetical protein